ncbi:F-box domain-containing protein [Mycena kentingensis (nom. inval.)]|nr:F-box domain-containing protein [Mycena kentingensis (nom. inval.)]
MSGQADYSATNNVLDAYVVDPDARMVLDEELPLYDHPPILGTPIAQLPTEILLEVFVVCVGAANGDMDTSKAPALLTLVCAEWRNLALHTPTLWTRIHILAPRGTPHTSAALRLEVAKAKTARCLERLANWMERSAERPLSISFCSNRYRYPGAQPASASAFLRVFSHFSTRWRSVELFFDVADGTMAKLESLGPNTVPLLEELAFFCSSQNYGMQPPDWTKLTFLRTAPRLTRCSFTHCENTITGLPVPWHNLLHLAIDHIGPFSNDSLGHVLRLCTRLLTCTLALHRDPLPFDAPPTNSAHIEPERAAVPKLQHFSLCGIFSASILSYLTLPSLVQLEIDDADFTEPHLTSLVHILTTSPSLAVLKLKPGFRSAEAQGQAIFPTRLVSALPNSLLRLSLRERTYGTPADRLTSIGICNSILNLLTADPRRAPNLATLALVNCRPFAGTRYQAIRDFLESRTILPQFRRLYIRYRDSVAEEEEEHPAELAPFEEAGVELVFEYPELWDY